MSDVEEQVLCLAGNKYSIPALITIGMSGPTIKIKENELNGIDDQFIEDHTVTFEPASIKEEMDSKPLILFKQHGKYTILLGQAFIDKIKNSKNHNGTFVGKLVSTPALKKARINILEGETIIEETSSIVSSNKQRYDREFANNPRIVNKRY